MTDDRSDACYCTVYLSTGLYTYINIYVNMEDQGVTTNG